MRSLRFHAWPGLSAAGGRSVAAASVRGARILVSIDDDLGTFPSLLSRKRDERKRERFRGTCGVPALFARAMDLTAEMRLWWRRAPADIDLLFDEWRESGSMGFEERTDVYLLDSGQAQIGIKLRNQGSQTDGAEIKTLVARLRSSGPCTAELWVKATSATLTIDNQRTAEVRKRRRMMRFRISDGRVEDLAEAGSDNVADGCNVEFTEVSCEGDSTRWWTLGFEAFGTLASVERNLSLTLERFLPRIPQNVLADAICGSYPAWLSGFRAEGD